MIAIEVYNLDPELIGTNPRLFQSIPDPSLGLYRYCC